MIRFLVPLIFLLFLSCLCVVGQTKPTRHFTDQDGLPSNNIRAILKDSRGVMWIGTDAGVCIFDGRDFIPFSLEENQSNKVWAIEEDENGNMWFGTYGSGLFKFDGDTVIQFQAPQITHNHVRVLKYSRKHKHLFVGTEYGFTVLKDSTTTKYSQQEGNSDNRINVMGFFEKNDTIFIHTFKKGMYAYRPENQTLTKISTKHRYYQYSSSGSLVTNSGYVVQGIHKNGLKVSTDSSSVTFSDIGQIFKMIEDTHGGIWIAAWAYYDMPEPGGFFYLKDGNLERLNKKLVIPSPLAWTLCYDEDKDAMWLGTDGDGLYLYQNSGISYFKPECFGVQALDIHDILVDNDQLIISAGKHLIKGNEIDGFELYNGNYFINHSSGGYSNLKSYQIPVSIKKFLHLEKDTKGKLWIGTDQGLFKEGESGSFTFYERLLWETQCFEITDTGSLFAGGWQWHLRIDNLFGDRLNYTHYSHDRTKPKDVNSIVKRKDELWFASWAEGLYCYKNGEYHWLNEQNTKLPRNITALRLDNSQNLIAATNDGKLIIFDYNDSLKVEHSLSSQNGIIGNSIKWLHVSKDNLLWIGTNKALNVLSLQELYQTGSVSIRIFNDREGFGEFEVKSVVEDKVGNLWLGGRDALVRINPDQLLKNSPSQKVNLKDILINNEPFDWAANDIKTNDWSGLPMGTFKLNHACNSFVFEYRSQNIINPDKDYYSVILEGFDAKYSDWSTEKKSVFTNLNPGKYTLKVKGKNLQMGIEYIPLQLSFVITPPWWATWWFYTLVVLVLSLSIWYYTTKKIKRVKKEEEEKRTIEQQITSLKTQAIQAQMNPHFIFNAITSVQSFMLSNDNESALDYLMLFADLIRKTLDLVSEKSISLQTELDYLTNYIKIESMRFIDGIVYEINVDSKVDADEITIPPLLLQPFVENSVKHGLATLKTEKNLIINVMSSKNAIRISIKDNGIGRRRSMEYKKLDVSNHVSKGLTITKQRIQQMYPDMAYDESCIEFIDHLNGQKAIGTEVVILIPAISNF